MPVLPAAVRRSRMKAVDQTDERTVRLSAASAPVPLVRRCREEKGFGCGFLDGDYNRAFNRLGPG